MRSTIYAALACASLASALPALSAAMATPPNVKGDAPYDVSAAQMRSVISCVGGITNIKNPYLLGRWPEDGSAGACGC